MANVKQLKDVLSRGCSRGITIAITKLGIYRKQATRHISSRQIDCGKINTEVRLILFPLPLGDPVYCQAMVEVISWAAQGWASSISGAGFVGLTFTW